MPRSTDDSVVRSPGAADGGGAVWRCESRSDASFTAYFWFRGISSVCECFVN